MEFPYIGISDRHTFGLDGGLPGDAAAPLLQRHLPVRQSEFVGPGAPGGPRPVAIGRGHAVGGHVHGCHQVGQLVVVFQLRLRPAGGVGAHVGQQWWFPQCRRSQLSGSITALSGHKWTEKPTGK